MENSLKGGIARLTALAEDESRASMLFGHLSLLVLFSKEVLSYQPAHFFDVFMENCALKFYLQ